AEALRVADSVIEPRRHPVVDDSEEHVDRRTLGRVLAERAETDAELRLARLIGDDAQPWFLLRMDGRPNRDLLPLRQAVKGAFGEQERSLALDLAGENEDAVRLRVVREVVFRQERAVEALHRFRASRDREAE